MGNEEPIGAAAAAAATTATNDDAIGVGVIGGGTIAALHLGGYAANPDARLVAVCDVVADRAEAAAAEHGADSSYTDYTDLLADDAVQAVSICTRNDTHAQIAVDALNAGKSVLIEKPLARTTDEADAVVAAERNAPGIAQVGFVRRFGINALVLKAAIDAGDLGAMYYAKATCLRRAGNPGGWFANRTISGGGPLMDIGPHFIDIAWWLLGKPAVQSVSGFSFNALGARRNLQGLSRYLSRDAGSVEDDVEDLAGGLIRFAGGAVLNVDVSYSLHGRNQMGVSVYGDAGGGELEPELRLSTERHNTIYDITPQLDSLTFNVPQGFTDQINAFVQAVRTGAPSPVPVTDGLEVTRMIQGIYESAESGQEIRY